MSMKAPPLEVTAEQRLESDTLTTVPDDGSAVCPARSMGRRHGVGKDTVPRIWRSRGLKPWRVDTFKLSAAPGFEATGRDVSGCM